MMFSTVLFASIVSVALSINNYAAFQSTVERGESVSCPTNCHSSNIETCFNTTTTCNGQLEYCLLNLTPAGDIRGTCAPLTSHSLCTGQQTTSPCDNNPSNRTSNCVLSCCASLLCMQLNQYNGLSLASNMFHVSHNITVTPVIPLDKVSRSKIDLVASITATGDSLPCPVKCDITNVQNCFNNTIACDGSHSYCHIMLDEHGVIRGFCAKSDGHNNCFAEAIRNQCEDMYTEGRSACVLSCCQSLSCLTSSTNNGLTYATLLFASALMPTTTMITTAQPTTAKTTMMTTTTTTTPQTTTAKPTTTPQTTTAKPTTTTTPSTTTTTPSTTTTTPSTTTTVPPEQLLYAEFANSCQDRLESGACAVLKADKGICQNVLSVELCAETCGVCKVIADANCHDIVLNNGCQQQYVGKGICGDFMAKYTCPASCGLCDSMVGNLLMDLLKEPAKIKPTKPTRTTTLPPTTLKPTTLKPTTVKPTTPNPGLGDVDIDIG